ncbi:hypothetical protein [Corynebacterium renale]|nr:hypothetical protein [Corynebacterium renale]
MDLALAFDAGEPQEITLKGKIISIKRRFTGAEVSTYMSFYEPSHLAQATDQRAWIIDQIKLLSDSPKKVIAEFVDEILQLSQVEVSRILVAIGKLAGLREGSGDFLPGPVGTTTLPNLPADSSNNTD